MEIRQEVEKNEVGADLLTKVSVLTWRVFKTRCQNLHFFRQMITNLRFPGLPVSSNR